jgi:hypothetical protein
MLPINFKQRSSERKALLAHKQHNSTIISTSPNDNADPSRSCVDIQALIVLVLYIEPSMILDVACVSSSSCVLTFSAALDHQRVTKIASSFPELAADCNPPLILSGPTGLRAVAVTAARTMAGITG